MLVAESTAVAVHPGTGNVFLQVDVVSRSGEKIPVSVWIKRLQQERGLCCVVVLEPVERVSAWVAFQSDVSMFPNRSYLLLTQCSPPLS